MGTPLGAVAIATRFKQRLEEWFEHPLGGEFHDLVLEAADPQRAPRLTARLRNVDPALGLGTVAHPFEAGGEILEIRLQIGCVHRLGHLIHAHGASIMASATPFCFCTPQKCINVKIAMNSRS